MTSVTTMKKLLLLSILCFCSFLGNAQRIDAASVDNLVRQNLKAIGLTNGDLLNVIVSDAYVNSMSGTQLVYLQQAYMGLPVYNQILQLAFKNNQLLSKSGMFISNIEKQATTKSPAPAVAVKIAARTAIASKGFVSKEQLDIKLKGEEKINFGKIDVSKENLTAQLMWVPMEGEAGVALAWQINFSPITTPDNWLIRVDANTNRIIDETNLTVHCNFDHPAADLTHPLITPPVQHIKSLTSTSPEIVNGAFYRVVPYPAESPLHNGGAPVLRSNPWLLAGGNASSLKWHSDGAADYNYTRGNNVWAYHDRLNNNSPNITRSAMSTTVSDPLEFDFLPDLTQAPVQTTPVQNQQFNITNLFYWNNIIHDLAYQYGFDEPAGNFQVNNQGRGGLGNDFVRAEAQDGGGTNNANFNTPADGGSGVMQMYLWNGSPQKDGDADNGIIIHEFAHGISNRLTGGPAQAGCLGNNEQMGEGWSDFFALMATHDWATASSTDGFAKPRGIGTYASGQATTGGGIRPRRYTTNMAINEITYAGLPQQVAPHGVGFVWCTMLWDMTWEIIQVAGINPNLFNPGGVGGNSIALKLVTEGMKLQPCSPGFIDGRDAILMADQLLYGGTYRCAIVAAFARRGLGFDASQGSSNNKNDGTAGFSAVESKLSLTQNISAQLEGLNITYNNNIVSGPCGAMINYTLRDTLPANVTYVSGGSYNPINRVVSFAVNLAPNQSQNYAFTVRVNNGSWFPNLNLFEDMVPSTLIPSTWTATGSTAANWVGTNARSHTAPNAYYAQNPAVLSEQRLTLNNAISLGATPPPLTFWHWFNTESNYDGAVLESSIDNGQTWIDLGPYMVAGNYTGIMATNSNSPIGGQPAWTGNSNGFIRTEVNLDAFANLNLKFRFRSTTDDGTNGEGWYVDDITLKKIPTVDIRSSLFSSTGVRVNIQDTFTLILQSTVCSPATVSATPVNVEACLGSNATFIVAANGTNLTYQWQVSNDGGNTYSNIPLATSSALVLANLTLGMDANRYRVIVNGECTSTVNSAAGRLSVATPILVTASPNSAALCAGSPVSFSVTATGPNINYQWQESTGGGAFTNLNNNSIFSGVASPTLNISSIAESMTGNAYRAVVSGSACGAVTTGAAALTVHPLPVVTISAAAFQSLTPGLNTSVTASVTRPGIYTYQWFLNNMPIATSGSAVIPVYIDAIGGYRVAATNSSGCSSQSNLLTIKDSASNTLFIYPNPNNGRFQVRYYLASGAATTSRMLVIYDAKGSRVFSRLYPTSAGYTRMDVILTNVQSGIYMVELRDSRGERIAASKLLMQ